jgi:hypothetical protein
MAHPHSLPEHPYSPNPSLILGSGPLIPDDVPLVQPDTFLQVAANFIQDPKIP